MNIVKIQIVLAKYDRIIKDTALMKLNKILNGELVNLNMLEEKFLKEILGAL